MWLLCHSSLERIRFQAQKIIYLNGILLDLFSWYLGLGFSRPSRDLYFSFSFLLKCRRRGGKKDRVDKIDGEISSFGAGRSGAIALA